LFFFLALLLQAGQIIYKFHGAFATILNNYPNGLKNDQQIRATIELEHEKI
jgi:hypothetical protein